MELSTDGGEESRSSYFIMVVPGTHLTAITSIVFDAEKKGNGGYIFGREGVGYRPKRMGRWGTYNYG
ncbi:hypothetical protein BaRGS_00021033, partial [Batillaria attramentaria]